MESGQAILLVGMILLGIAGLLLGLWLLRAALIGAIILFTFAGEQGFIGLAAYVACWVFLFPAMLVICIIVGIFAGTFPRNSN